MNQSRLPGGWSRSSLYVEGPVPRISRGRGYRVFSDTGADYIDVNNNFTTLFLGHAHPGTTRVAKRAVENGSCFGLPTVSEEIHAEQLVSRLPGTEVVRYANTGTEAVMIATRVARALTGRDRLAFLGGSYHGWSDSALVAASTTNLDGIPHGVRGDCVLLPLNDIEALERLFADDGDSIAALTVDLLPNRLGLVPVDRQWASAARRLCARHGAVLIVDEVVSFRLAHGGLQSRYDIQPDLTVLGKTIGGGLAIGAVAGSRDMMAPLDPGWPGAIEHGGTFTANPVALQTGAEALRLMTCDEIARLNTLGDTLRARLSERLRGRGWEARGWGSLFRLVPSGVDVDVAKRMGRTLWQEALDRGLLLQPTGAGCLSTPMDSGTVVEIEDILVQAAEAVLTDSAQRRMSHGGQRDKEITV